MRILLTGSSGWLGRHLGPRLRALGHGVIGLDVAPHPETAHLGSVADAALVRRLLGERPFDAVVHAGALHKPDIARFAPGRFVEVNVAGTLNLLEASIATGVGRFVLTSTTSLMISDAIRREEGSSAIWLDETTGPLEPRNIYGVTKLTAEGLCRMAHLEHGLACIVLRTARFFPEEDDTHRALSGENQKANELLYRRLTVEDAAEAHVVALERAPELGWGLFVISAPSPFARTDAVALKRDAAGVVRRLFPRAEALYAARGWTPPRGIGRVYDAGLAERVLGFRCATDFGAVLRALEDGAPLPFAHDPGWVSPSTQAAVG